MHAHSKLALYAHRAMKNMEMHVRIRLSVSGGKAAHSGSNVIEVLRWFYL